ncbi:transcription factor E2F7 isoform X1 [Chrysemys picta bellii]|uniref:transcription factor E2F7 isoform X1 n=1 Tax=Chrysemys picta bellii TaxID=8478 RepID=UPI00046C31E3|nr:transcription factor E2F7 isoform X1 [Chrysemys picta bellii]
MEVSCLTLKDLISPRHTSIDLADEDGENAQKENIFDQSRMTPKTPMKNEPIDLSKQKGCTPERNPITPVKLVDRPLADPWTPTANLKMLISAASPDMRDREKKKELFRPIENSEQNDAFPDSVQYDMVDDGTVDEFEKQRPSRKQKSLGLLCQKFLARYPSYPLSAEKSTISLDEVASSLGVERRRIYDIVNVLESLHLVSRVAKNQYCWHGRHSLSQTLKNLQEIGELQKYEEQMAYFQHKEQDLEYKFGDCKKETFPDSQDRQLLDFSEADCPSASANSRKDKSLRIMSQKFVMLFLVSKTKIVTLDIAAKILIEESQDAADHSKFKTKVRRLYDIANVLTSLGLIKKVHVTEERGRKPAFKWIGPVEFSGNNDDPRTDVPTSAALPELKRGACAQHQTCPNGKQRLARHASFNTVHPSEGIKRKVSSEPNSPHRERQACIVGSNEYCSKMINLAAVCRQKMEKDTKNKICATETILNSSRSPAIISPFSVLPDPGDSDFCLNPLPHPVFPVAHSDMSHLSLPNGMNGQVLQTPTLVSSKTENGKTALLPNQPFVYLPSASLFMLCGSPQESLSRENLPTTGEKCNRSPEGQASPLKPQAAVFAVNYHKRSSQKCASLSTPAASIEPAAKRKTMEQSDVPLSLVLPKKPFEPPDGEYPLGSSCASNVHLGAFHLDLGTPAAADEAAEEDTTKPLDSQEQEKQSRNRDLEDPSQGKEHISQENTKQPFFPQYLYVQPAAGLSGFNFLFSANQTPGAVGLSASQLPSLSVPCVVVPSTALAPFPLICSPAITNPLSSAPACSFPNTASTNFSMPGLTSTPPVFIGTTAMVTPKTSKIPSMDPHPPFPSAVHLSPVLGRSCNTVKLESPVCTGPPVTLLKLQQPSSTPLTPKSIRPTHHEAFFKTPGSLGDPIAWKKNEGNQTRNASSVQRRLEISSSGSD